MSTDCSMAGLSIPFKEKYQDKELLIKFLGLNEEEFEQLVDPISESGNWEMQIDDEGRFGIVLILQSKWDDHYLVSSFKISEAEVLKEKIPLNLSNMSNFEEMKSFAFVYYNGSEYPLVF